MKIQSIAEIQEELAKKLLEPLKNALPFLGYTLPEGHQLRISLLKPDGRKTRSNAAASNWSPEDGRIEIWFEHPTKEDGMPATARTEPAHDINREGQREIAPAASGGLPQAEVDLLQCLGRAEARPGWNFVPLKKFRDEIVPQDSPVSMRTDAERRAALESVIRKRLVLVNKVINPKSPQFPVSTVRLNRLMPEVRAALKESGGQDFEGLEFHPVHIPGEPLSATILRERR